MTGTVTRMSQLFVKTLREDPADAEVPSHRLLVRAGYVRRVASGIWSWLPLGMAVLENIEAIVHEEMASIGAQRVAFPALLPTEPYEATGRMASYGPELFRLKDRRGADMLLGPTHEEMFTLMVKELVSSWRDLPVILYQVQAKYRDEPRPRSGILRGREFLMKDSYSFDIDDAGLAAAYELHRGAYERVFTRIGLDFRTVHAHSGAMGGSASEEFLAISPVGEDTFVYSASGSYAANVEAAHRQPSKPVEVTAAAAAEVATPGASSIDAVAGLLGVDASKTLKSMVFNVDGAPAIVLVRGDREVIEDRVAEAFAPAEVTLADEKLFAANPYLVKGYIGPQGMQSHGVKVLADLDVVEGSAWVVGGNAIDVHVRDAVVGRDFSVDLVAEVGTVVEGDLDPVDGQPLSVGRGIEMGHIFQLGRSYAEALHLEVAAQDGKPVVVTMGSYGIGVSRAVAAIVEQHHDDVGIIWPKSVAPFGIHLVSVGKNGQLEAATQLAGELAAAGHKVLFDDRGISAGVAFKDAELLGMPTMVVVGKALAEGTIEVKDRATGERRMVLLADAITELAV